MLPSKTFGELVEQTCHTPAVDAPTLAAMLKRGDDVVVLDGRPLNEHRKMTIPGSVCCPNGELSYRVYDIVSNPATTIVVNCAGIIKRGAEHEVDVFEQVIAVNLTGTMRICSAPGRCSKPMAAASSIWRRC